MSRIIFVPQFPTRMRYPEWWFWKLPTEFANAGFSVVILGEKYLESINVRVDSALANGNFAPNNRAIEFETSQINEYMTMEVRDDDILFLADLSFPGLFANILHHKKPYKMKAYAFCHATSLNDYDYFSKVRHSKFPVEAAQTMMFENIFVGSHYHYNKLAATDRWPSGKTKVVGLPMPPERVIHPVPIKKNRFIISTSRPSIQKVDTEIEDAVMARYNTLIGRQLYLTWQDYCVALSESRVLLVTSREETFGYQVVDAIINGCIPVVPNAFSYPELIPNQYRYSNLEELFNILDRINMGELGVPELLCKTRINNFYDNIIQIMKGVRKHPF